MEQLASLATMPIAVSPDEALTQEVLWSSLELPFPVLIDPNNTVAALFGAISAETSRPRRVTTVVDRNGIVRLHETGGPALDKLFTMLWEDERGAEPAF